MTENREVKSDVFCMLMEDKRYALEVYNIINHTSYDDPDVVEVATLKKGISVSIRNDAAIILDSTLSLYEHQSRYSPNMPLRSLIYLEEILKPFVENRDIYGRNIVKIPTPRFVVFYNGREKRPAVETLKLSDAFEKEIDEPELELVCTVYNINPGSNDEILEGCKVLSEYTQFIERVRNTEKEYGEDTIKKAIEWAIEHNILKDFLEKRGAEVLKNMTIDMTFERREELIRRDERQEVILDLVRSGNLDISIAAKTINMSEEELKDMLDKKS